MRRNCAFSPARPLGVLLIIAGLMLLIFSLPFWLWMALVGAILAILGVLLFKIG